MRTYHLQWSRDFTQPMPALAVPQSLFTITAVAAALSLCVRLSISLGFHFSSRTHHSLLSTLSGSILRNVLVAKKYRRPFVKR